MRILAVSDLHGELSWLQGAIERFSPELLLCAGDWGDPGQVSPEEYEWLLAQVPVLSIYGNHDDRPLLARLRNQDGSPVLLEQGEARRVGGVMIGGISGIWAKTKLGSRLNARWEAARRRHPELSFEQWVAGRELPPYVTDDEIAALARGLAPAKVEILVMHACPSGLADRTPGGGRGGQRSFREAWKCIRPRVLLCGHLHRLQRVDLPEGRLALNTGHGAEAQGWQLEKKDGKWKATSLS